MWTSISVDHYKPLLERLSFEPKSLWRAQQLGSNDHFGWDQNTYLLATITDSVNTQLKGKKLSDRQRVKLPKVTDKKQVEKFNPRAPIKDLHLGRIYPD